MRLNFLLTLAACLAWTATSAHANAAIALGTEVAAAKTSTEAEAAETNAEPEKSPESSPSSEAPPKPVETAAAPTAATGSEEEAESDSNEGLLICL